MDADGRAKVWTRRGGQGEGNGARVTNWRMGNLRGKKKFVMRNSATPKRDSPRSGSRGR